ncbi:carbohydrate kinase family protein [Streptosporangium sp. 'caverna']|uniref:carbohydrate kinase family protein n=1 Tax=Streptosporangium sp. 'caverna' TaxID=2202249 RepID=UPI000D7D6501|nr:PfkB family carbohydrate kinase [Streptosporangium sp. 'caverna']AWS41763.1 ribokinase [Streptosporangium sp. 'caverna']
MALDVICVGVVTVDTITTIERMPAEDDRVLGDPFVVAGGGPAATAAVALARLGASVGFCGVVGDDDAGKLSRRLLEDEGVDTRWLRTRPDVRTPQSMIMVSRASGSRSIVTSPSVSPDPGSVPTRASRWLHVDQTGYDSVRAALRGGSDEVSLSIDGGNPIPRLDLRDVDLYSPTVGSLRAAFPAEDVTGSLRAAAAGARRVVATAGGEGCEVLVNDRVVHVPPVTVDPVSTMGAGDVFHGALLAGLVEGRSLVEAAWRANVVAALSCRALDGRSGIPDAAETEKYLSTVRPAPWIDEYA